MTKWPKDNQDALLAFYGTPGPDVERQLVPVVPPFQMYYDGKPIKSIRFHRKAAPALKAALDEIWEHYGRDQRKIDALGISKYNGAYNPRKVRGSDTKWSNHAYGAAIDINADDNGFGRGHGSIPQPVIDAFKRQGARWGGDYRGRTDPMHFEFCDATGYPGPSTSKPAKFVDAPQTDSDGDQHAEAQADETPTDISAQSKPTFFRKVSTWVKTGLTGLGFGGLGVLTDWQVAAITFGFVLLLIIMAVSFVIWFFGADPVRTWVRKQVA